MKTEKPSLPDIRKAYYQCTDGVNSMLRQAWGTPVHDRELIELVRQVDQAATKLRRYLDTNYDWD